jgi:hypothetical protein
MKKCQSSVPCLLVTLLTLSLPATAAEFRFDVTVDGADAIFIAGRTDLLPIPRPNGDASAFILLRHPFLVPEFPVTEQLPPSIPVRQGAIVNVVDPAIGGVSFFNGFGGEIYGPDGNGTSGSNISSLGGISGYKGPQGPLVGVFLDDSIPTGSAPSKLDFTPSGLGRNFASISPALGQVFFIGNGIFLDAAGKRIRQRFIAPAGATRLVLGIPDAALFVGEPGFYDDNDGGYSVRLLVRIP